MKGCFLGTKPNPESFGKWAKKHEIFLHPDIAFLVPTKTMGAGVFARRALPAGTVVVSCPLASSICPYTDPSVDAPSEAFLQGLRSGTETLTVPLPSSSPSTKPSEVADNEVGATTSSPSTAAEQARLERIKTDNVLYAVLRLLAELGRKTSPYRPWLEACPRMDEHLFSLTAAQKEALGVGSVAADRGEAAASGENAMSWTGISQQLRDVQVEARWRAAQWVMVNRPDLWPASVTTRAMFNQCLAQVLSRNFHREEIQGREGPYLLPGLDILNHSFGANAMFEMRGGGRKHETCFTVVTTRPLAVAEQVYVSYGRIGAARFAVEFQFTTTSVLERDLVRFSAETIVSIACAVRERGADSTATDPAARRALREELMLRIDRLQRLGILFDEGFYLSCATHEQLNGEAAASGIAPATVMPMHTQSHDLNDTASGAPLPHHRQDRQAAEEALEEESEKNLLTASVVLYAMMLSKAEFDDLYHAITRDWIPPFLQFDTDDATRTAQLKANPARLQAAQFVYDALEARRRSACEQMAKVAASFAVVKDEEGQVKEQATRHALNRRRLLEAVLESEATVVAFYQKLLCRFSGLEAPPSSSAEKK